MESDHDSAVEMHTGPDVTAVFVANHRAFLSFLERRVGSRAAAEDLLQEAFVRGVEKIKADNEQSVIAWFYEALRNAAVDYHRRSQTSTKALTAFAAETADRTQPDEELRAAVCQCVRRLADTLRPDFATAIRRVEVDGVAVKDYAAEAGITPGNAAVRVFRAREALRKQVTRSCGSCAEHGCLDCTCGGGAHQGGRAGG
jgi:RNA polymerase sigma-70 factor (ECF subfamily)